MPHRSTLARHKMKETEPEKYALFLAKMREFNQKKRDEEKRKWEEGALTEAEIKERELKKEVKRRKERQRYKCKLIKAGKTPRTRTSAKVMLGPRPKKPREMSPDELRLYKAAQRRRQRHSQSSLKKAAINLKRREDYRKKRDAEAAAPKSSSKARTPPRRLTNKFKKKAKELGANSEDYAQAVLHLINPTTRKKTVTKKSNPCKALFFEDVEESHYDMENELGITIQESPEYGPVGQRHPPISKALHDDVKLFYCHSETSSILPLSRYLTKDGPARVMNSTIKAAHAAFLDQNPAAKISLARFQSLRPKNCRLMGSDPVESYLCIYCTNVRLKIKTLNQKLGSSGQIPPEKDMLYFLTCPHEERWPKIDCIDGKCGVCSDRMRLFNALCRDLFREANELKWQRWERNEEGKTEPQQKQGSLRDLLKELERDLTEPTKGTSFVQHLFMAYWQSHQFKQCRRNPEEGEVVMVQDFGENRKAAYSAEIRCSYFGKQQITVHPIVCFYRKGDSVVRESLIFLSDDTTHDHLAVQDFTNLALVELEKSVTITKLTIWSDGAACQYEGGGSCDDLTLLPYQAQRCYYGSEHGTGESDGEIEILSQTLKRATLQGLDFPSALKMADFLQSTMGTNRRKYLLVDVIDCRPLDGDTQMVPGTRKLHQFQALGEFLVQARWLSCFCTACREGKPGLCFNREVVGPYIVHECTQGVRTTLNESSIQAPETDRNSPSTDAGPENPWPNVGDFLKLSAQIYKSRKTYYANVIEVNKETNNFSVRFLQRCGKKYSFGENDDVESVASGPPDFYSWVILNPSQWRIDRRELYSFLL